MKIIIVGDGKVGFTLAEHLSREEHDVTIIDTSDNALQKASDTLDKVLFELSNQMKNAYSRSDA